MSPGRISTEQLSDAAETYCVGGLRLPRPFRIRRLGHFGFNVDDVPGCLTFYRERLGLRVSDRIDYRDYIPDPALIDGLGEPYGYFLRHGTDHHSFVLFNRRVREALDKEGRFRPGITANQITWQVGSLQEVVDAVGFLSGRGTRISRSGRDTPGSNWHTYVFDPEGHTVELYYGIEQIGWNGRSKPKSMYDRGFKAVPPLPQISEQAEVAQAAAAGLELDAGHSESRAEANYEVDGVLLPRPFSIAGIGPVGLFVEDMAQVRSFYEHELGLTLTGTHRINGCEVAFLRAGAEHHAIALYPMELRKHLPVRQDTTSLFFGFRLASFAQLRAAATYLAGHGVEFVQLPPELTPGMRHAIHVRDPDGHLVQLYCEMEQLGWSGQPRDPALVPNNDPASWPEAIDPLPDTHTGEPFLGPWL